MTAADRGATLLKAGAPQTTTPILGTGAAPVLRIRELSKRYGNGPLAVDDVSLTVESGELVVLLGANGSGKSTLLRCAVRLVAPTSGSVEVAGRDFAGVAGRALNEARRDVAMIFQQGHLVRRRGVAANVACGALGRTGWRSAFGGLSREQLRGSLEHLDRVGMREVALRRASSLSGGQAQRVAIARALSQRPRVLLADEPVASLDPDGAETVMTLLRDLAITEGLGILCVLHQPELALRFAHRIAGMRDGRLELCERAADLEPEAIAPLYANPAAGREACDGMSAAPAGPGPRLARRLAG